MRGAAPLPLPLQVLAGLQDRTSPHPWAATLRLLRQDFGADFADFHSRLWLEDTLPVASGCCAQVLLLMLLLVLVVIELVKL